MTTTPDDAKAVIDLDTAISMLPDGDMVHTFRGGGMVLIGADHGRSRLIEAMRRAPEIELTGPNARRLGHGLCIWDDNGCLFIATKRTT